MAILIGKSLQEKSAGTVKQILLKRYPDHKGEIDECIVKYFGKDEGAAKLNRIPKNEKDVNASSSSAKAKASKD